MFNIDEAYTNPHDVFNKKAAMEYLQNKNNFKKKAKQISPSTSIKKPENIGMIGPLQGH